MPLSRAALNEPCTIALSRIADAVERGKDPVVVYLEGGHFSAAWGVDDFCLSSQAHAQALAQNLIMEFKDRVRIVFGVMREDIGLTCGEDVCVPGSTNGEEEIHGGIPDKLRRLLEASPVVKMPRLMVFSERTAKNRGIARLRRIFPDKRTPERDPPKGMYMDWSAGKAGVYFTSADLQEIKLADVHDGVWNAKCPTLMGQHYADVLKALSLRFHRGLPVNIIDFSVIMDRNKVTRGSEAALRYFRGKDDMEAEVKIVNLFYDDPEGKLSIVKECASGDF